MSDKDLYVIAVLRYKDENPGLSDEKLFPFGWHVNSNYHLKVEIIAEAITNHVLVNETKLYKEKFVNHKD